MKWFAETTVWSGSATPNHVYLLDNSKSKMYAYQPFGSGKIQTFKSPIGISARGRKFVINPVQHTILVDTEVPQGRTWSVKGSKGDEYTVSEYNGKYSCTCSGFQFRGKCKHTSQNGIIAQN